MKYRTLVLKKNSEEIRQKIRDAGIDVCWCASHVDADWLDFDVNIQNGVHGNGYAYEGMTKEQTRAMFLDEDEPILYCKDVDEFINEIQKSQHTQ